MTRHTKIGAATGDRLIVADASKVTPLQFLDALGLSSPEQRAANLASLREQCINAIERGDTYGWPPLMVADCRKIMAENRSVPPIPPRHLRHLMDGEAL